MSTIQSRRYIKYTSRADRTRDYPGSFFFKFIYYFFFNPYIKKYTTGFFFPLITVFGVEVVKNDIDALKRNKPTATTTTLGDILVNGLHNFKKKNTTPQPLTLPMLIRV